MKKKEAANRAFYSLRELAEAVGVSLRSVQAWRAGGKVKVTKFGRATRIPADEYERVLREGVS
ncbi:helix-turn-helix domain-containing protein [Planctomycetota bacterium]|nr:helix-turn-helix domain-containing protein [Planctomycetota bacterium]